ncbi:PAS domain-containing protein [Pedobacter sp. L105]|uniref:PAS domain-containing protein n=1 Tax=Pedobacter sp. L105 TaxID=1641871 RepID=UPI00131AAB90
MRGFFNSSPACHILIDTYYRILDYNKETETFFNEFYGKQIKNGKWIIPYIDQTYQKKFINNFQLALKGNRVDKEFLLKTNNYEVWWSLSFQPISDDKNKVISVAFTASNVNERKNKWQKSSVKTNHF